MLDVARWRRYAPKVVAEPLQSLRALIDRYGEDLPLDRAMFAAARVEYPEIDEASYLTQLDALAERALEHLADEEDLVAALRRTLFAEARFRGAGDDYYDPRNSLLSDVLDRRLGIPITLAIVYIEVARRAGGRARGVGFPGHFLVQDEQSGRPVLLDPFASCAQVEPADCERILSKLSGGTTRLEPWMLAPTSGRAIIARVLTNLKHAYLRKRDTLGAVKTIDRLLVIEPERSTERRDRGLLYAELGLGAAAEKEIAVYLASGPNATEAERVSRIVSRLRAKHGPPN